MGEIELMSTTVLPWKAGGDAVLRRTAPLRRRRVRHHDVKTMSALLADAFAGALRRAGAATVSALLRVRTNSCVAGRQQVARHRRAHDAEADEADVSVDVMSVS